MSRSKWNAVNTPAGMPGKKLDEKIIGKMSRAVQLHYKVPAGDTLSRGLGPEYDTIYAAVISDVVAAACDVFILEKEEEFKFGKGKKIVAITDGGKNSVGNPVKYVKWFNLYEMADRQDGQNSLKVLDKTYTYGIEKARVFWNEKIKEGYNRVI